MFIYENNPVWDLNKERIIGSESESFCIGNVEINASLPYKWWRLEDDTTQDVLGYGWIEVNENARETEISICIAQEHRGEGIGKKILNNLEQKVITNNFPHSIIANICGSNRYAIRVIRLLQKHGYASFFPIETIRILVSNGQDVTFTKELNI